MSVIRKYLAYLFYHIGDAAWWIYQKSMEISADVQGNNGNGPWSIHDQEYHYEKKQGLHK